MGFMQPVVEYGEWVEITHDHGSTTWVPAEDCPSILPHRFPDLGEDEIRVDPDDTLDFVREAMPLRRRPLRRRVRVWERKTARLARELVEHGRRFKDFIESGHVEALRLVTGWGARLSAPGYMDCTEWSVYDTEEEAKNELCDQYDLCEDCGEDLDADYNCPKCKEETP